MEIENERLRTRCAEMAAEIERLSHERQCLAEAIGSIAIASGDTRTEFTGPDLLMVCGDAVEGIKHLTAENARMNQVAEITNDTMRRIIEDRDRQSPAVAVPEFKRCSGCACIDTCLARSVVANHDDLEGWYTPTGVKISDDRVTEQDAREIELSDKAQARYQTILDHQDWIKTDFDRMAIKAATKINVDMDVGLIDYYPATILAKMIAPNYSEIDRLREGIAAIVKTVKPLSNFEAYQVLAMSPHQLINHVNALLNKLNGDKNGQ